MKITQYSEVPIYQQIANQLRDQILSGQMKENEYLPSIRGLAKDLKISVITTMKAYEVLTEEGLVTAVQGKGYLVNPKDSAMIKEQLLRQVEDALHDAIAYSKTAGLSKKELKDLLDTLYEIEE